MCTLYITRGFLPILCILYLFVIGCAPKTEDASLFWQITFVPLGAELHFTDEAPIKQVSAFTSEGTLVAQLNFPTAPRQIETVYFAWQEGETYRFEAISHADQISEQTVTAPRTYPRGSLEIAIPYGTADADIVKKDQKMLMLRDSEMTATVIVKNGKIPTTFNLELCLPAAYAITRVPANWKIETVDNQKCLSTSDAFHVASEVWFHELGLKTSDTAIDTQEITGTVRFTTLHGETWEQKTMVQIRIAAVSEIADKISVVSIDMPTDVAGIVDLRQRTDTIYHPRPLFSWLGSEQTDPYVPISYQTIRLQNRGEETVHVVVTSINRDVNSGDVVSFLAPPDAVNASTDRSISLASLPAGDITAISLPIYFHPQSAETGTYERNIAVKVWGSDSTVLNEKRPLHIVVPNRHALYVSGLAVIASCVGLVIILRFHRQFFVRFTTKQLIVIALFGTTVFVTVVVPSTLFLNLIRAVFGPFSVLVTGLVNETLYYALLTALLIYIGGEPNKKTGEHSTSQTYSQGGVILLVSAVRLLLGGVTFGLFTPMTIIFTGTSVLLLEGGFFLVRRRGLLMWGVVLGICDAIAVYVDFQLSILFYRLFYADWYIWLRIVVEGFAYTFIGVLLGAKLGRGLWKVAD
ncbi:hypothetical protein F4X73_15705 [Candidatus Poribacteria bacterium]|nr:hypothetical protein [Candidatus Poribacteria bacterium]MYB66135.1 hypothetical protein [Candidatus Poribacteria bacterium]